MSCPACDKGQKRKCICGRRRTYNRRALDGVDRAGAVCPCARMPNGKRHRQHPRADCLHGIALKAQQNGPRGVVGKRQRRKGGK